MEKFKKGEDIAIEMLWEDAAAVLPPSALLDYKVLVYSYDNNVEDVLTFAKTPSENELPIVIVDDAAGTVRLEIDRVWSAAAESTNYFADVYWFFVDASGIDGKKLEIIPKVELFKLLE